MGSGRARRPPGNRLRTMVEPKVVDRQPSASDRQTDGAQELRRLFLAESLHDAFAMGQRLLAHASGADGAAGDPRDVAGAAIWLARIARRQERFDEALRNANIALTAALACGDAGLECTARVQQARVLSAIGQTEEALDDSYAALRAGARTGAPRFEAVALEALADVQWSMAQWEDALASFTRMLEVARACGDIELECTAHGGLGGVHHYLSGQPAGGAPLTQEAAAHFQSAAREALEFQRCARQIGDGYNLRTASINHAVALLALGDTVGARAALEHLLAEIGDTSSGVYALALKNLGDTDFEEGHRDAALARYRAALLASEQQAQPQPELAMVCCEALVTASEAVGDLGAALDYHRRFHALYVQTASNTAQAHARAMAVRFDTEQARTAATTQRARAERLESSYSSLSLETDRLSQMSRQDALTGIGNRRHFDQALQSFGEGANLARRCSLALLDIDHFKRVNDQCSHQIGDAVLRRIGAILAANSRRGDVAARYGGEEFALIFADLDHAAALTVCERVRAAIENEDWGALHPLLRVTISIGLAHHAEGEPPALPQEMLALADRRLYAAKQAGRNRVVDFGSEKRHADAPPTDTA